MELFSLPPRVFGCIAFAQDLSPNLDKLSPHSVKCVFVGYSHTQQGYRCFDPSTRTYIVSADVTFFESQHYFEDSGSSSDGVPFPSPIEPCEQEEARPLKVYCRRQQLSLPSPTELSSTPTNLPPTALNIPIALRYMFHHNPSYITFCFLW